MKTILLTVCFVLMTGCAGFGEQMNKYIDLGAAMGKQGVESGGVVYDNLMGVYKMVKCMIVTCPPEVE